MIFISLAIARKCWLAQAISCTAIQAEAIDDAGIETVRIRSVLTCETRSGDLREMLWHQPGQRTTWSAWAKRWYYCCAVDR